MSAQPPRQPAFRHLDLQHVERDGQRGLAIGDPLGLIEGQVFIPEGLLPIAGRFDGVRTIEEIAREVSAEHAQTVPTEFVAQLVAQLDERLLLRSPRFELAIAAAAKAFIDRGTRPARHAGSAGYPADPQACRAALEKMIPRPLDAARRDSPQPGPRGLIAPHIDLARGETGYAQAYGYLATREPADLYVIFGTGHQGPSAPVTGLAMDWDTPLGTVRSDRAFLEAVHTELGAADPVDAYLHRDEHSIEFQVLCLAHLFGPESFAVAGFLTGSLPSGSGDPSDEHYVRRLLATFRTAAAQSDKRICFVAGADLAHLGPFFGDHEAVDAPHLERLRTDETARLRELEQGRAGAFHRAVEHAGNPDRVCGTTPIYLTASLAGGAGELLHYGQAHAPDGSQVVSFCSMAFPGSTDADSSP